MRPATIKVDKTLSHMTINWDDGHISEYPFLLLRNACPCAECRGGHAGMSSSPDPSVFEMNVNEEFNYEIRSVNAVGSYGVSVVWEDGHDFGIYTWKFLRDLCPCSECRS